MIKKIFKVFIILNLIFLSSLNVNAEEREFDIENFNNEFENKNGLIKENEKFIDCIKYVNKCATRLRSNSNFEMSIDNLLFEIWEEINEKSNRS